MTDCQPNATRAITVLELNRRLSNAIAVAPDVRNVWVVGETGDVRVSSGHCYLELLEKADDGSNRSRIRAIIWANSYRTLADEFLARTGTPFASGIKVRVKVTASYHPSYGMSVNITEIDATFTVGDAVRRRNEIIARLTAEGIIELNRSLPWAYVPNRIAVISARGAAGYGDFINQLYGNSALLRFDTTLFEAVMQGERTAPTVRARLAEIRQDPERFDAVVIIRGGGSTSDLAAFDDYDLAADIARFPIPVIIGIGHERDITVLDYVAKKRVKTPTAAAEFLIERIVNVINALGRVTEAIYRATAQRIAANRELLAHAEASLPGMARASILSHRSALERYALNISSVLNSRISRNNERLNRYCADIEASGIRTIERSAERLRRADELLKVLSPDAVLARGFSLTLLPDGSVLKNIADARPGTDITTRLADGSLQSRINDILPDK